MLVQNYKCLPDFVKRYELQKRTTEKLRDQKRKYAQAQELVVAYYQPIAEYLQEVLCWGNHDKGMPFLMSQQFVDTFLEFVPKETKHATLCDDDAVLQLIEKTMAKLFADD